MRQLDSSKGANILTDLPGGLSGYSDESDPCYLVFIHSAREAHPSSYSVSSLQYRYFHAPLYQHCRALEA